MDQVSQQHAPSSAEIPRHKKNRWNSLEIVKIIIGIITPITIAGAGWWISDRATENAKVERNAAVERQERETRYEKVLEKRSQLWDQLGPKLNDIYAYLLYVGRWNELKPSDIIERELESNRIIFSFRPYFSEKFLNAYGAFMNNAFKTRCSPRVDVCIRTMSIGRREKSSEKFTNSDNRKNVHSSYYALLTIVGTELDIKSSAPGIPPPPQGSGGPGPIQ